jgi:hypothetical protein
MSDADLFRALIETVCCLAAPGEVLARPAVRDRLARSAAVQPPRSPALDRSTLLQLLDA